MKIAVFGRQIINEKLCRCFGREAVELIELSEALDTITLVRHGKYDLVVVDSLAQGVEVICNSLGKTSNIPVVLLLGRTRMDWSKLKSLPVSGYIHWEATGAELAARLKAIARRWQVNGSNVYRNHYFDEEQGTGDTRAIEMSQLPTAESPQQKVPADDSR